MFNLLRYMFGGRQIDASVYQDLSEAVKSGRLNIGSAVAAHVQWKQRLQNYLQGRSTEVLDPKVICQDDQCDLGRWIHGSGGSRLGKYPGFTALRSNHRMFHYLASRVVELHQSGQAEEALKMLQTSYTEYSDKVCEELRNLDAIISA